MKILYITPKVNNEGGVAKSLSVKTNYFIENFGYSIDILTQDNGNYPLFHAFNSKIGFHDIDLKGSTFFKLFKYKEQINKTIKSIQPDVIVVSDNGLKGYLVPVLISQKIPVVFECHGSILVEERKTLPVITYLKSKYKKFLSRYFTKFIVLSIESQKEWNLKNCEIIPNSVPIPKSKKAALESKKVIAISRHSYEKGLDRMMFIWKEIHSKQPNWILEIFGDFSQNKSNIELAKKLQIEDSVKFLKPELILEEKYLDASIMIMTSRTEGFPMALLEANSFGLPIIAYDCPIGPRTIINNNESGFLITDNNKDEFVNKLNLLMNDLSLRKKMGEKGQHEMQKFNPKMIMNKWDNLFQRLIAH